MPTITDDFMREILPRARTYSVVILRNTPKAAQLGTEKIVWEHARRNFELRAEGKLAIVCPIQDKSGVSGVGIFTGTPEEVTAIMDGDPGVRAGVFTFEVHPCRSFPGDMLP